MNKKLMALVLAGVVVLSGCQSKADGETNGENANEATTVQVEAESNGSEVNEEESSNNDSTIESEFEDLLKTGDLEAVKNFILENGSSENQDFTDNMIVNYDKLLRYKLVEATEKYERDPYTVAIMEARDENYQFKVELIKDETIKSEITGLLDSGFTYICLEGDYYLTVDDSKFYDIFKGLMSKGINGFYNLKNLEISDPSFTEEMVNVSFSELKNRAMLMEDFIRNYPEYYDIEMLKNNLTWYVNGLVRLNPYEGGVNENGEVSEELKNIYKDLMESDYKVLGKVATEIDAILAPVDYKLLEGDDQSKAIDELRQKYFDGIPQMIDESYLNIQ